MSVDERGERDPAASPPRAVASEVSVRMFVALLDAARQRGASESALADGTGYTVAELRDARRRVPWEAFLTFCENLGRRFSDDELVGIGMTLLDAPLYRALFLPGRLLFTLPEIYRWGAGPGGPVARQALVQDLSVTELDARTLRITTRLRPGYRCVREFWMIRLGLVRSVPCAFGLPPAAATLTVIEGGAYYDVALPRDTRWSARLRGGATWLFATKDAAAELRRAHDDLHDRYLELQAEVERRKTAEAKLRELNAELERRVETRTRELERANRELEGSNAELSRFSSSVAHDLRTPLRAISGFADVILEDHGAELGADVKRHLDRIVTGAVRMGAQIDALLLLARVGRTELKREPVDLGEIAASVLDALASLDPSREVEVRIGEGLSTEGDPALLRSLMENLLGNAWKFTRGRRATIEVGRIRLPDVAGDVFRVRDNGVGFDPRHARSLFAPFQRLQSARDFEGMGIGLAIVDRIVRRHGGTVWADAAPDEGSTFFFTLAR